VQDQPGPGRLGGADEPGGHAKPLRVPGCEHTAGARQVLPCGGLHKQRPAERPHPHLPIRHLLQLQGNYDTTNTAYLNTTNTTASVPAALIADALTILSTNWQDKNSNQSFSTGVRPAANTTVDAAVLAGVVPTTGTNGSAFSGGVQNLPRLLEDWGNAGSTTLTMNTSLVNFYPSQMATNQWQDPGVYYYAPTRPFNYDTALANISPPGCPAVTGVHRN
jgi:hypothetical protein